MEDNTLEKSNVSTTIHARIENVDIPAWCFTLPGTLPHGNEAKRGFVCPQESTGARLGVHRVREAVSSLKAFLEGGLVIAALLGTVFVAEGCTTSSPSSPSPVAVVTFAVQNETFAVSLTSADQLASARSAQNGGRSRIPNGRIVTGTDVNTGWSWHLEDLAFAETTTEVCDGRPSDVERQGARFGGGRFCPWTAIISRIDER